MDPLSDVLSLLRPRSYACGGFDMGAELSIRFPAHDGIKCYAVVSGETWLVIEGVAESVRLATGDCFVLPRGLPFRLASDPALTPVDFRTLISGRPAGAIGMIAGGGACTIVGGHFALDDQHARVLLGVLPPVVHIREEADRATLRWSLDRMMHELRVPQPGGDLVVQHVAQLMLVQALRLHVGQGQDGGVGWLFALADRQLGAAIGAIHADPAQRWTVQSLATRAGMSRTRFAEAFKTRVGVPPMDYLTRWRMQLAADGLARSRDSLAAIAVAFGYRSESAFSTAFKRVMGVSPRQYGRDAAAA